MISMNGLHSCDMAAKCQNISETVRALFKCSDNSLKSEISDLLECISHPGYVVHRTLCRMS